MTAKERLLAAIRRTVPDRLPATTHHVMPYFLQHYMNGCSNDEFFDHFGLDPMLWTNPRTLTDSAQWRITSQDVPDPEYKTLRYTISTPKGALTMVTQSNEYTTWVKEYLIKDKRDIELIAAFAPVPQCDAARVNADAADFGERGLIRGHICMFDIYGQPGTWQDACCLVGTEKMIMATYDDPAWVHELLNILLARKLEFVESLRGASYDILELGGGDASTTVISPRLFRNFVAPYDRQIIAAAHQAGQRIVYHTCGGMMPILEDIAAMEPDAMETFTPPGMGADVNLAEAKRRIGDRVCMIGGFDQGYYLQRSTPEETRAAVRACFEAAGAGGGYILAPSDHFFDAKPELIRALADEARQCVYA